ncbi:galanin receptor 2a-like [Saccoglossus kowalevskii]|uniref:Galanin receptor type 2-like n=1 Tax=Saccoglossus kowalevskii TaxID=10224 RepID=A0ABM0MMJ6_SACKO|nr:PREDICTED: galanin receptor type 2-like [Saccoglossus kowalevskii]
MNNTTEIPWNITTESTGGGGGDGSDNVDKIMKAVFAAIGFTGIVGNTLVIMVFVRMHRTSPSGLSSTNIFILNQSCMDLMSSLLLVAQHLIPVGPIPAGIPGDVFCKLWASSYYPMWACFLGSTFNLVLLTFERYFAICHPIKHHTSFTQKRAKIMVALVWPFSFGYELHWAMVQMNDGAGGCTQYWEPWLQYLGSFVVIFQYIIPIIIMACVYISILRVVRRSTKIHASGPRKEGEPAENGSKPLSKTEKNIIQTLLIVAVTYIICWSPNQIVYFGFNIGFDVDFNSVFFRYGIVSVCANMCINPFIYACKLKDFREQVKKIFGCKNHSADNQGITLSTNT